MGTMLNSSVREKVNMHVSQYVYTNEHILTYVVTILNETRCIYKRVYYILCLRELGSKYGL